MAELKHHDIVLGQAIYFAGDLEGGGRFRTIGVVIGGHKSSGDEGWTLQVQRLSSLQMYEVTFDGNGNVIKPTLKWDADEDSPAAATDDDVRQLIADMTRLESPRPASEHAHFLTRRLLERLGLSDFLA